MRSVSPEDARDQEISQNVGAAVELATNNLRAVSLEAPSENAALSRTATSERD